jgi:hypothetical protein
MSATSQKPTSGSLKLFWIGVDASRHGIMLGAFRRLDQGDAEIKGGASLAIRRVLLASQVALAVMPSPGIPQLPETPLLLCAIRGSDCGSQPK